MLNEAIRRQEILNLKRISFKKINKKRCATKCVFVDQITNGIYMMLGLIEHIQLELGLISSTITVLILGRTN